MRQYLHDFRKWFTESNYTNTSRPSYPAIWKASRIKALEWTLNNCYLTDEQQQALKEELEKLKHE